MPRGTEYNSLADLLGKPDEDPLGTAHITEPIDVFVLDHLVHELGAEPTFFFEATVPLVFMNQMLTPPEVLRHRMSDT